MLAASFQALLKCAVSLAPRPSGAPLTTDTEVTTQSSAGLRYCIFTVGGLAGTYLLGGAAVLLRTHVR